MVYANVVKVVKVAPGKCPPHDLQKKHVHPHGLLLGDYTRDIFPITFTTFTKIYVSHCSVVA